MSVTSVEFPNDDGIVLRGRLHAAEGCSRGGIVFAHCFTCTASSKAATTISRHLAESGFDVLRFDFTGLGESEGDFADSNFSTGVEDILAAWKFLEGQGLSPELLIGHSFGGTAVLAAAEQLAACKAVATIAAPSNAEHVKHLFSTKREAIEATGSATVDIGGRPFHVKRQFLDDLAAQPARERLRRLRCALLVMHAPLDDVVEIENASEIFMHALHPKSFVTLDDADHLLTRSEDAEYAARVIAAWSSRYIPAPTSTVETAPGWVSARTPQLGFATRLSVDGHELLADEPESAGGTDRGPSPYELLSAALASCTSMTLQIYARHKGIDLRAAVTHVRHSKIHAQDCEDCETREGRIDRFEREIELVGEFGDAQRARMLEIADRCPVHVTLSREIKITTRPR